MKKKVAILFVSLVFITILTQSILADDYYDTEQRAYDCLLSKVEGSKCDSITDLEDQIFALWATEQCQKQVMQKSSNNGQFWSASGGASSLELTAKALIALKFSNEDTDKIANYLLQKNSTPQNMDWFLQVDANEQASCTISYTGGSVSFTLEEDRTITNLNPSGGCLSPFSYSSNLDPYWLKVKDTTTCLESTYTIQCDKGITTNFLYREKNGDVFYVAVDTNSIGANEPITEKINSLCFKEGTGCNFEGSLWAALALDSLGYDIAPFLPYIIANTPLDSSDSDNLEFVPEAFVYQLREYSEYWNSLRQDQSPDGYWRRGSSRYYDTALALLPFIGDEVTEKTTAKEWLNSTQRASGCWGEGSRDDIGDTAFVLLSIWPRSGLGPECTEDSDCLDGYECKYGFCIPDGKECAEDRHCPDGVCIDNMCVDCRYDDDCPDDLVCVAQDNYTCHECDTNSRCEEIHGEGWGCNDDYLCERLPECDEDNPCGSGEECIDGYCMGGFPECSDDSDCTDEFNPFCINNTCVECIFSTDCDSRGSDYICVNYNCILDSDDCTSDDECSGGKICDDNGMCVDPNTNDCEAAGYYCRGKFACIDDGGNVASLTSYLCDSNSDWCCDVPAQEKTCSNLNGIKCLANQKCEGGQVDFTATDTTGAQICCVGGSCVNTGIENECEDNNVEWACRSSCFNDETSTADSCTDPLDVCCIPGEGPNPTPPEPDNSLIWIIVFAVLIVLVIIGIIFRDKLSLLLIRFKGGSGRSRPMGPPGFPPPRTGPPMMRRPMPSRRIIPSGPGPRPAPSRPAPPRQPPQKPASQKKPSSELDDVLKKLKELGK